MRLCRGDCAAVGGRHASAQTPELVGRQRSSAPSSRRSRPSAHDSTRKPCASLRAAQIIATTSNRFLTIHAARQQEPSRRVRPAPTRASRSVAQPPRISGRLRIDRFGRCRLARSLAPAQSARGLEGGEKGVSLSSAAALAIACSRRSARAYPPIAQAGLGAWIGRKSSSSPHTTNSPRWILTSASIALATAPRRYFSTASRSGRAPRRGWKPR